jgi:hypothetical protein
MVIVGIRVASSPHAAINDRLPRVEERVVCAESLCEESNGTLYFNGHPSLRLSELFVPWSR